MSKVCRICFIGLGSIGTRHLKNMHTVANSLGMAIEVDALRHTRTSLSPDVAELIKNEYFNVSDLGLYDIIFLNNPSQLHYKTLTEVLKKAEFFFVEKPVFTKPLSQSEMSTFLNVHPKDNYYVACPIRHTEVFSEIQKIVNREQVISTRAICSSYLPDWRPNTDYRKLYSSTKESGGVKLDLIHEFDYLYALFGFPEKHTLLEGKFSDLELDSVDVVNYLATYPNMFLALHLDYFGRKTRREIEIYTNNETYLCDFVNSSITELTTGNAQFFTEEHNSKYLTEMTFFLNVFLGKVKNINDLRYANAVLCKMMEI